MDLGWSHRVKDTCDWHRPREVPGTVSCTLRASSHSVLLMAQVMPSPAPFYRWEKLSPRK